MLNESYFMTESTEHSQTYKCILSSSLCRLPLSDYDQRHDTTLDRILRSCSICSARSSNPPIGNDRKPKPETRQRRNSNRKERNYSLLPMVGYERYSLYLYLRLESPPTRYTHIGLDGAIVAIDVVSNPLGNLWDVVTFYNLGDGVGG